MAGLNIQSNHESYPYNIQSDQLNSMDSNYTNGFPLKQTIITDFGYANMDQPISMGYNGIHSYQHNQTPLQPPGQDSFPSDIGPLDHNGIYMGVNKSVNTENYGYIRNNENVVKYIQSDQLNSMDSNCTNDLLLNQTTMDQPIVMNYNGIHSYHHNQTPPQPPGQDSFPSNIGPLDHNGIYMGVNESLNTESYGYIRNNENVVNYSNMNCNCNSPLVHHSLPQTSSQMPYTSTRFNNAGVMTNATSHGCIVIIMKADINLENLLSIIQGC
ncbi:2224_t:CDS:1 [Paraglomus brasilianum]|uniref:2224_t:CDS:1 n=1 Tax=Paraglomus brasilianum TaxID=144538 RepID=A0A9N8W784_9GLOM|nr:2224_t:CDS:1 [Paraglomus brasilianum]